MYDITAYSTPTEALTENTIGLYGNYASNSAIGKLPINLNTKNATLQKAIEQTKTAAKYSMAASIANIFEAQAGVDAVTNMKTQYNTNKSLINRNIATTQSVMMANLEDNMAQLDAVAAAKNVDINSQAIRFSKEKALIDMGQDFATMDIQGDLQKAALDLQYSMQKSQAKSARNKALSSNLDNLFSMAEYLL